MKGINVSAAEAFHFECHQCHCSALHSSAGATRPIRPCVNFNALRSAFLRHIWFCLHVLVGTYVGKGCVRPFVAAEGAADQPRISHRLCLSFFISCRSKGLPSASRAAAPHSSSCVVPPNAPAEVGSWACSWTGQRFFHFQWGNQFFKLLCNFWLNLQFKVHVQICGLEIFLLQRGIKIQLWSWPCIKFTAFPSCDKQLRHKCISWQRQMIPEAVKIISAAFKMETGPIITRCELCPWWVYHHLFIPYMGKRRTRRAEECGRY